MNQNSFDFIYICVNLFYTDNTTRKFNFSSQHFSIKRKFFPIENEEVSKPRYDIEFKNSIMLVVFTFIQKILNIYLVIFVAFLVKIYIFFYFCCQKCPFQFFKPLKNIFLLQSIFPTILGEVQIALTFFESRLFL